VGQPIVRKIGVLFLVVQGAAVVAWWVLLLLLPAAREPFLAPNAPDATLFAFLLPDLAIYASSSLLTAYGLAHDRPWAWSVLSFHSGAALYATLYALTLPLLSGGAWLGAAMMVPALLVLPVLLWLLRPANTR
jgi:hypothetical protein